ncbi:unnamed protein product [Eruca vesicaria subsp. sativa]|uniref:Uncharacterized protein n=1 Tax=Eruca vesicaria subsp. sativa TaxID=29727 RepID=A0ABC8JXQ9_ERUVS|nr:unnamed protein product [Eruca vesicaria subsp. sativa]
MATNFPHYLHHTVPAPSHPLKLLTNKPSSFICFLSSSSPFHLNQRHLLSCQDPESSVRSERKLGFVKSVEISEKGFILLLLVL